MTEKRLRALSVWAMWKPKVRTITLNVKLNIAINAAMIITMVIFLALAYFNERRTLILDSTRHLTGFLTSRKLFKEINPLLKGIKANIDCLKNLKGDPAAYEEKLITIESDLNKIRAKFYVMESEVDSIPIV